MRERRMIGRVGQNGAIPLSDDTISRCGVFYGEILSVESEQLGEIDKQSDIVLTFMENEVRPVIEVHWVVVYGLFGFINVISYLGLNQSGE